jgi:S-methylmethionine-dependent homocysteine/selenocysteine methylase
MRLLTCCTDGSPGEAEEGKKAWRQSRPRPLVAFSAGPFGAALADGSEYDGGYADRVTEEQIMDFHRHRLQARTTAAPLP